MHFYLIYICETNIIHMVQEVRDMTSKGQILFIF